MLPKYDVDTYGPHIPDGSINEIFNSIVRIEKEADPGYATGFFLKIKIRNRELNSLITNHHVISKFDVYSRKIIYIYYGNKEKEIKKPLTLDTSERFIRCYDDPKDITIIEIKNYDYIPDYKFLLPDLGYKNGYFISYFLEKSFLAGYPGRKKQKHHNGERHISSGRISDIYDNNIEFEHTLDTRCGSSGAPICLLTNGKVIGVHKAHRIHSPYGKLSINVGTFIGVIIDELKDEYYLLPEIKKCNDYDKFGITDPYIRNFMDFNDDFFNKSCDINIPKFDDFGNFDNNVNFFMNKKESKMFDMSLSLFDNNISFQRKDIFISNKTNKFIKKEKKLNVNRNKTPIGFNKAYYEFKESFTENYIDYNYSKLGNFKDNNKNKNMDYKSNINSLIRIINKSFEKLKFKKKNKKKKNKKNVNNITTYSNKYNQETFKFSKNAQSFNFLKIKKETKNVKSRNNNNYFSYISKSCDKAQLSISKKNNNINLNFSTINNKKVSYGNNNYNNDFNYNNINMYSFEFSNM